MHLDQNNTKELTGYLRHTGLILPGETLTGAEKAGEGNMNYTLRIRTADRTFILKQARPYVEKYPSIPAPVERAGMEAAFFKVAGAWAGVGELLPSLLFSTLRIISRPSKTWEKAPISRRIINGKIPFRKPYWAL